MTPGRPRIAHASALSLVGAALALATAACATGGTIEGSGGAGVGGSGPSSGTKSSGSKSTSSNASMSTASDTTMSNMSSTAVDPNCEEQPCKLLAPQCGCSPDRQCSINEAGERACIAKGTAPIGGSCVNEECTPGSMCLGPTANALSCLEFCADDGDCEGPGGICYFTIDDGNGGAVPGATLCTQNCDPASNTGCAPGLGCQAVRDMTTMEQFTFCAQAGAGTDLAPCTNGFTDCAPTFGCFTKNAEDICLQWCQVGGAGCSGGLTCYSLTTPMMIGSTEYGVCD